MPQPLPFNYEKEFSKIVEPCVKEILKKASEYQYTWCDEWLSKNIIELAESYRFNTIQEIVPFCNRVGHYAIHQSAEVDGHVKLSELINFLEEVYDEIQNTIFDISHKKLWELYGEPAN